MSMSSIEHSVENVDVSSMTGATDHAGSFFSNNESIIILVVVVLLGFLIFRKLFKIVALFALVIGAFYLFGH